MKNSIFLLTLLFSSITFGAEIGISFTFSNSSSERIEIKRAKYKQTNRFQLLYYKMKVDLPQLNPGKTKTQTTTLKHRGDTDDYEAKFNIKVECKNSGNIAKYNFESSSAGQRSFDFGDLSGHCDD